MEWQVINLKVLELGKEIYVDLILSLQDYHLILPYCEEKTTVDACINTIKRAEFQNVVLLTEGQLATVVDVLTAYKEYDSTKTKQLEALITAILLASHDGAISQ